MIRLSQVKRQAPCEWTPRPLASKVLKPASARGHSLQNSSDSRGLVCCAAQPSRHGGISYDKIAKRLNAEGITSKQGGTFDASTIWKIAGNDLHRPAVGPRQRELWPTSPGRGAQPLSEPPRPTQAPSPASPSTARSIRFHGVQNGIPGVGDRSRLTQRLVFLVVGRPMA